MTGPVGFYPRYSRNGASSRLRFYNFAELWREAEGGEPVVSPFFPEKYLENFYRTGRKSRVKFAWALLRRLFTSLRLPPTVILEHELLPGLPAWMELLFLRNRRFFLDFDDFAPLKYSRNPLLRHKHRQLVRRASGVTCGSDFLADWARKYNPNVLKLPTPFDPAPYRAALAGTGKRKEFTVAWIGSPATEPYLTRASDALAAMAEAAEFTLLVISAGRPLKLPCRCRFEAWDGAREAELLSSAHVGIMPLPQNDAFAAGKSGYKLIQYAAAGLPAIASPVGENRRIVKDGETGFFASAPAEWAEKLRILVLDGELRRRMSEAALANSRFYELPALFGEFRRFVTGNGALQ